MELKYFNNKKVIQNKRNETKRENEKGDMFLLYNKGHFNQTLSLSDWRYWSSVRENDKGHMFLYHNKGIFS